VRVRIAFAVALALLALAVAAVLSGSPTVVAHTNSTLANGVIAVTATRAGACQAGEQLPARISAIRLTLASDAGPTVAVQALAGARVLTSGSVGSGWSGGSVSVPVRPVGRGSSNVRICFRLGPTREKVELVGVPTSPASAARSSEGPLPGRIKIEYLRSGGRSWLSLAETVARRMGLGRAPSGTWVALLVLVLMGGTVVGASWLALRELG
jgi:hypothetical protein